MHTTKLIRNQYQPKKHGITTSNEPTFCNCYLNKTRLYPDMKKTYDVFMSSYHLKQNSFILGNGCENILKNVLLALKPTTLCWAKPTWEMVDVLCAQLNIMQYNKEFSYDGTNAVEPDFTDSNVDAYYATLDQNNLIGIDQADFKQLKQFKAIVLDMSYSTCRLPEYIQKYVLDNHDSNIVLIGSYDKSHGCGLRCGFAIFPEKFSQQMQLQRENFINAYAADFIQSKKFLITPKAKYLRQLVELTTRNEKCQLLNNFILVHDDVMTDIPCKKFKIHDKQFTRFGYPCNKLELQQLTFLLKTL